MTGGISLILNLFFRYRHWEPGNKIFGALAALCLLIACFLAWSDERVAQQGLGQNVPNLSCKVENLVIGEGPDTKSAQIFIQLSVRNAGTQPSLADNYKLHVKAPDIEVILSAAEIPVEYTLTPADKSQKLALTRR